jgi:hypothetical protein
MAKRNGVHVSTDTHLEDHERRIKALEDKVCAKHDGDFEPHDPFVAKQFKSKGTVAAEAATPPTLDKFNDGD